MFPPNCLIPDLITLIESITLGSLIFIIVTIIIILYSIILIIGSSATGMPSYFPLLTSMLPTLQDPAYILFVQIAFSFTLSLQGSLSLMNFKTKQQQFTLHDHLQFYNFTLTLTIAIIGYSILFFFAFVWTVDGGGYLRASHRPRTWPGALHILSYLILTTAL